MNNINPEETMIWTIVKTVSDAKTSPEVYTINQTIGEVKNYLAHKIALAAYEDKDGYVSGSDLSSLVLVDGKALVADAVFKHYHILYRAIPAPYMTLEVYSVPVIEQRTENLYHAICQDDSWNAEEKFFETEKQSSYKVVEQARKSSGLYSAYEKFCEHAKVMTTDALERFFLKYQV